MASSLYCARCLTSFREDTPHCPNLGCGQPRPAEGWGAVLGPGDLLDRHYRIERPLAVGGAGITYLAHEVDAAGAAVPPELAIKVLYAARASGSFLRRLATEAQILQELDHDNIVRCRGFVQRAGHQPYLVTLFEHGGSLTQHVERVGPLPARVAAGVLRQVLLALDVAHQRGVVHRDLKPDNVLLGQVVDRETIPHVRVGDFGIAKVSGGLSSRQTRAGAFLGTPEFAAPEQFRSEGSGPSTDLFAAGGLLFYMLTGQAPVALSQRVDLEGSLHELLAQLPPRLPAFVDPQAGALQEVVDHTLLAEPESRWTAQQVIGALGAIVGDPRAAAFRTIEITGDRAPDRAKAPPLPIRTPAAAPPSSAPTGPAPSLPPEPPAPVASSAAPERSARGGAGCLGLLAGLGAAGGLLGLALGASALALVGAAAWSLGWFDGSPGRGVSDDPPDLGSARELLGGGAEAAEARRRIQASLDAQGAALGAACGARGPVVGTVVVDERGEIVQASIDARSPAARCVEAALAGRVVDNPTGDDVVARVAFVIGP